MGASDGYGYLIQKITESLDEHAPRKYIKIRMCDKFRDPWMTVQIKCYNLKSRKLCDKARITGMKSDYVKYKRYRNTLNRIKLYKRKKHYEQLFGKIGKNASLLWNVVNNIVQKSNNCNDITELEHGGSIVTDKKGITNAFNEHFATAGQKVKDTILCKSRKDPLDYVRAVEKQLLFSPISEQYLCKIVMGLKA